MNEDIKAAFFDGIADKWDGWEDQIALCAKLSAGLDELGVQADETILDVGCGTGNLTRALLEKLSSSGRVTAVDISPRMIEIASGKVPDTRVTWYTTDAARLPLDSASFDRIICYSVWPHFDDKKAAATELYRLLRPKGSLHVWHLLSRAKINEIHASAGPAVHGDILPPAGETASLFTSCGFFVTTTVDSEERYLVTASKVGS